MTVQLVSSVKYAPIEEAISLFRKHYKDQEFLDRITRHARFNFCRDTGNLIATKITNDTSTITIGEYTLSGRSIASTNLQTKTINFNTVKYENDPTKHNSVVRDRVNTIMHEYIHTLGYKHLTNFNFSYNRGTAPYTIGELFVIYLSDKNLLP